MAMTIRRVVSRRRLVNVEEWKMRKPSILILLLALSVLPARGYQELVCGAPALSDQAIKEIIDKERAARDDLPAAFPESRWVVRRQGCYYVYIEYGIPEAFHKEHIFKLNRHGVIVDAGGGNAPADTPGKMKCPDKVFTKVDLAAIVRSERAKRRDLPQALSSQETQVERLRCLYLYYEYALPKKKGDYQVFTFDPYGELMDVYRSKPEQ
jgi:hypothetical protein